MGILSIINQARRHIMRGMARYVASSGRTALHSGLPPIRRVLISRPNHRLGNLLMVTPLVQEVEAAFPGCRIDLFVKGDTASAIFRNFGSIDRIISLPKKHFKQLPLYIAAWFSLKRKRYDMVINVIHFSSSGRLSTKLANAPHKVFGDVGEEVKSKYGNYRHAAKQPVYHFRDYLENLGCTPNMRQVPNLGLRLGAGEIANGKTILEALVGSSKKTISIFTHASGAKRYSPEWWEVFYERLKAQYPQYNIVEVLPVENVSQIGFKAPSFYSKDIREIAAFIANTEVFIGADSGVMHLASAAQVPVVGLFSVSDPEFFAPYGNGSIALKTNDTGIDHWIREIDKVLARGYQKLAEYTGALGPVLCIME